MSSHKAVSERQLEQFRETLKRCPAGTLDALLGYRETGDLEGLNTFLLGCIQRHTEDEYQHLIDANNLNISFVDDLGIDSMTMIEIVMMVEECLEIKIDNQDLMKIRNVGDLKTFLANTQPGP